LTIPNVYRAGDGKLRDRLPQWTDLGSSRIRALILEGHQLRAMIASTTSLNLGPERTPMIFVYSATNLGHSSVISGEKLRIAGADFLGSSHSAGPVQISFDGRTVAGKVLVRTNGTFSANIPVQHLPGEMIVMAEQHDGYRVTVSKAIIDVVAAEHRK
jgi:hypothetical protein